MAGTNSQTDHVTLVEKKGRHHMFPAIGKLSEDRFAILFHDAPARTPAVHYDPKSILSIVTGEKPSKPDLKTQRAVPRFSCSGYTPAITRFSEDRLVITDNAWYIYNWLGEFKVRTITYHNWVVLLRGAHTILVDDSSDKLLFGKPRLITCTDYPILSCYGPPIIEEGNILLCVADYNIDCSQSEDIPWETVALRSVDQGRSWSMQGRIYFEKDHEDIPRLCRPSTVQIDNGRLICFLTSTGVKPELYSSASDDNGQTWSRPEKTDLCCHGHSLLLLRDGRLMLLSVLPTDEPYAIHIRLSEDEGRSWPEEAVLKIDVESILPDYGRPNGLEMDDGSIFVVYYSHTKKDTCAIKSIRIEI